MVRLILLLVISLAGCTGHSLPEPSGPLRVMNSGNDVLPGTRAGLHD